MSLLISSLLADVTKGGPGSGRKPQGGTKGPLANEPKSNGHLFFTSHPETGTHEYFAAGDSAYHAQVHYPSGTHSGSYLDTQTGYRSSGRFETRNTPQHIASLKAGLERMGAKIIQ